MHFCQNEMIMIMTIIDHGHLVFIYIVEYVKNLL